MYLQIAASAGFLLFSSAAYAQTVVTLISDAEARMPPPKSLPHDSRAITRGPKIVVVTPSEQFRSPGPIKLSFQSYGGVKIDDTSVRAVYLREPEIDITTRIKPFVNANGVDLPAAAVPAGEHSIRVDIKDADGRAASKILTFKANPQ